MFTSARLISNNMCRLFALLCLGTATLALSVAPCFAQESFTKLAELRIQHFTKPEVIVMDPKGNRVDTARLESEMRFGVPSNTRLKIVIVDPNPLLYKYTFKGVESAPSENYKALEQLAAVLGPFAGALKKLAGTSEMVSIMETSKAVPKSEAPRAIDTLLADLSRDLEALTKMAAAIATATAQSVTDPGGAKTYAADETLDVDAVAKRLEQTFAELEKTGSRIVLNPPKPGGAYDPAAGVLTLALHYEPETMDAIKAVKAFRADAAAIGVPMELGDVSFVAGQIQTATFSITLRNDVSDSLKASRGAGQFKAVVEPLSPVAYSFAPGYVYTWIRKVPGVSNQQMAGILNVTPRRWISSDFSAGFNLGVTGTDAGLGVMAGMSVMLARGVQVGLGAIYRDVGKDGRDFRPGGYLLLAVDLGKKK